MQIHLTTINFQNANNMFKSEIIGRLGKDAEEATQGQRQVLRFSVATDDRERDSSGNWVKTTLWVSVQTYQTGLKQYLTKGRQVYVTGNTKVGTWTRKDGTTAADVAIFGADVTLLGGEAAQGSQQAPQQPQAQPAAQQPTQQPQGRQQAPNYPPQPEDYNDQLPF